jgi:hypothetical protein
MNQPPNPAPTPYGRQNQPQQAYVPMTGKRPGSTSTKVWGVLLLAAVLLEVFTVVSSLPGVAGSMTGTEFNPTLSTETKERVDEVVREIVADQLQHWSYWPALIGTAALAVISAVASFFLLFRPKPRGRTLAIAAALFGMLMLPVSGASTQQEMDRMGDMQEEILKLTVEDRVQKEKARNPRMSPQEEERLRTEMNRVVGGMGPVMEIGTYVMVVFMAVVMLVFNALMLFFMTRPGVKDYLLDIEQGADHSIPQYDPSMGIMTGPLPEQQPPPQNTPLDPDGRQGPNAL